jgi:hypothetical protein
MVNYDRRHPTGHFDTSINVSAVLSAIAILIGLWGLSTRLEARLTALETRVDALWSQYNRR